MATIPSMAATPHKWDIDPAAVESTHAKLTAIAVKWLRRANSAGGHGCQLSFSECWAMSDGEKPDAIGWRNVGYQDGTVLVEVKASRADFLADSKKPHRQHPETGVGRWRYFMCPEGMISPDELPPHWGLLWVTKRNGIRAMAGPAASLSFHSGDQFYEYQKYQDALDLHAQPRNVEREMAMLVRLLHRVPDAESANMQIRNLNNFNQNLRVKLEQARIEARDMRNQLLLLTQQLEQFRISPGSEPVLPSNDWQRES